MRKLLGSAALSLALMAPSVQAQSNISDTQWEDVRGFLERNPDIHSQLEKMMDREIGPEQIAEDAAYIAENTAEIFENPMSPVLGNPDGDIQVAVYTDFRCPYCKRTKPELMKLVDSNPRVKLVIKEWPILGPDSSEAAKFALAAYQAGGAEAYATVQAALFDAGGARMTGYFLEELAQEAGLDPRSVIEAMDSPEIAAQIEQNHQQARALKITGTPAIIIGSVVARGAVPFDALKAGVAEVYGAE